MSPALVRLADRPELLEEAAGWFHDKWGVPAGAYRTSMRACLAGRGAVPQWYLALDGGRIVGGMGVIENDFHVRKDLAPNVCAVYIEPDMRGRGLVRELLNLVCADMRGRGIRTLYLVTDHTSLYERLGWRFLCLVREEGSSRLTRLYVHQE